MALKQYRPTTPGQRQLVLIDRTGLHKGGPVKALTEGKHSSGGRNNTGRIVVRWQGGGHKQRYRFIDNGANSTSRRRSNAWSTIRTGPLSLLSSNTRMANSPTFWLRNDWP
jgi:ribosomal protein L2